MDGSAVCGKVNLVAVSFTRVEVLSKYNICKHGREREIEK